MSTWSARPGEALWYGEVVFIHNGETDYNYAYSADMDEPDPSEILIPGGSIVVDMTVIAINDFDDPAA